MTTIEIVLLIIAYSFLIVTLFLELICYKKNIESIQTIAFTASLLLLIIALTISAFLDQTDPDSSKPTNIFILFSMLLLGLTTPLNVLEERQHSISPIWKKLLIVIFGLLFSGTAIGGFIKKFQV